MGGGDLNMKKSWHVNTLSNIERVWKAEQKDAAEKRKIEELRKEIESQRKIEDLQAHAVSTGAVKKKDERVDFMYAGDVGPGVDRDEYLLGRRIDAHVELDTKDDLNIGSAVGATFNEDANANSLRDTARKVRDDPLFAIKRKEQEGLRSIMNNPVRIQQLKMLHEAQMAKDKKSKKLKKSKSKKEKKEKKHKKSSHKAVGPDDSDSDSDGGRRRSHEHSRRRSVSPPSHHATTSDRGDSSRSRDRERPPASGRHAGSGGHRDHHTDRGERRDTSHRRPAPRETQNRGGYRERDPRRRDTSGSHDKEAEMKRKLEEMKANADWHDETRAERAKEHAVREAEQNERDQIADKDLTGNAVFLQKFQSDALAAAAASTVGDRIERNRHYVQRTAAALDTGSYRRS